MQSLKQRLRNREVTFGSWLTFSDPAIAEIMSKSGFDWLTIDMEHSPLSFSQAQDIIRVIDLCGVTPFVRVTENSHNLIKRFMDAGAHGVIVPMVNSRDDAIKVVNAVKYPPTGYRGVGLSRAQNYSMDLARYTKWNQESSIIIVQVEHIKAVENLESIMSVDEVDGFIIGLYDLSGSLGHPGDFEHPLFVQAMNEIYSKAKKFNYLIGQHIVQPDPKLVIDKIKEGIKFIAFGVDFLFLGEYCKSGLNTIRNSL